MTKLTRKYQITFARYKTKLVVTYYNNQFKNLEYKSGGMARNLFTNIGRAVPLYESEIKAKLKEFPDTIGITKIEGPNKKSQYTLFLEEYILFFQNQSDGVSPKIDGVEGSALKKIITYLNKEASSPEEAFVVWKQILDNWNNIEEFYQKQLQIRHINSNLNTIIIQIKNGKPTDKARNTAKRNADDIRKSL